MPSVEPGRKAPHFHGTGTVVRRWDNVKVDGHADAVLEAVQAL